MDVGESTLDVGELTVGETTRRRNDRLPFRPIACERKYLMDHNAGYLLPTDDRYREHHDHIWIVLQFVE